MLDNEMKLKVYSRDVKEGQYPNGLAYSVHFSVAHGKKYIPWRNNYGLIFPKASVDERNVIVPAFTRNIKIAVFNAGKVMKYVITGENVGADGEVIEAADGQEMFWSWMTEDFISFSELGLTGSEKLETWTGLPITKIRKKDTIEVPGELIERAEYEWNRLEDGEKAAGDDAELSFPLFKNFGDPVVMLWEDEYYFIGTNDNVGDIGIYAKKAHTPEELFDGKLPSTVILDKDEKRGLVQTFWAPEFHVIGGSLYILFAVSNEQWGPQCHIMKLKENGDIMKAEDWEDPVKITKADGSPLGAGGITLDMTYVHSGDRHYFAWSYREHIGSPLDSGSMIMIAEFSPENPYKIISEPVCLTRPLYGFENTCGTINNEGPYALYHNGRIYLTYSGGDARGYLYTVGLLTADDGDNLCIPRVWEKAKTPVLSFASVPGQFGAGHNSFFCDRNGDTWIAFHATRSFKERTIYDGIRKVRFDKYDNPRFD